MVFLYPYFLFAIAAVSIPIIIHLFNFRQFKVVYFSNVRYLKNIKQETKAKSQLKHLLVLLCRILAIISLVFAFAQPFIPLNKAADKNARNEDIVSIYIDNSFSMDAESEFGNLFQVAKNKARNIAEAYPSNTKFLLITNDFELRHQHFVKQEQLAQYLDDIKVSPVTRNISEIFARQQDFLSIAANDSENGKSHKKNTVFLISDFQKSTCDLPKLKNDSTIAVYLIPLATQPTNNLYIDSCWFETPGRKIGQTEELNVKIVNKSDESYQNIPLKFLINDSIKALGSFNIQKNSSEIVKLSFTNTQTGIIKGKVEIVDYPVTYDNLFYINYSIADSIQLLVINEKTEDKYLNALFKGDLYISLANSTIKEVKPSVFNSYNVIVMNAVKSIPSGLASETAAFVRNGGTFIFLPNLTGETSTYNELLSKLNSNLIDKVDSQKTTISYINFSSEIYKNVFKKISENPDMPLIIKYFTFQQQIRSVSELILQTQNKKEILTSVKSGKGRSFIFSISTSAESGNFAKNALFVPTLYNIVLFCQSSVPLYYTIGKDEYINLGKYSIEEKDAIKIKGIENNLEFIPNVQSDIFNSGFRLGINHQINQAGNYLIAERNKPLQGVAFNYDRKESDLSYYEKKELDDQVIGKGFFNIKTLDVNSEILAKSIQQLSQGEQLWKLFIILALLFLGTEIALLRFWKG